MSSTEYDPLNLAAVEHGRNTKRQAAWFEDRVASEDLKWLMSSRRGRRIVWSLLERAGVWRLSFSTNAMQTAFNEGRRNEGLALTAAIHELCPERYVEMLQEQKKHDNRNASDDRSNIN